MPQAQRRPRTPTQPPLGAIYQLYLEYAPGGTLRDLICKNLGGIPESEVRSYVQMILKGLSFVHRLGYVHCDIKPDNILLFPSKEMAGNNLKIADFRFAKRIEEVSCTRRGLLNFRGIIGYVFPESVLKGVHKLVMDIWTLGCMMVEVVTRQPTWKHRNKVEILQELVFKNGSPKVPKEELLDNGKDFLKSVWKGMQIRDGL